MSSGLKSIRELYYITHIDNIPSMLKKGILSHEKVVTESISFTPIYDNEIVINRSSILVSNGKDLWSFANLYFQPRNPMLYRVIIEKGPNNIAVLSTQSSILNRPDIFITTGNAASYLTEIRPVSQLENTIREIQDDLKKVWWKEVDGSKRKIMAECLVPDELPPEYIKSIYVANHDIAEHVRKIVQNPRISVIPEPKMFFQPYRIINITPNLSIAEGDMFFSRVQTLTVSVNCVGIMGKGIASRAKYQFPDVYVTYQDLCRKKKLRLGKPNLYKRETSFDHELADEPFTLTNANHETWFLLFATKDHWRKDADIHGIEKGLEWILKNYNKEGIKSLALPALGCGLGNLKWEQVGPLMCKYLSLLEIPVSIYLPLEKKIPDDLLTSDFLLSLT